jgi:hypothetical protein
MGLEREVFSTEAFLFAQFRDSFSDSILNFSQC